MAKFYEQVKNLIRDIDKFLVTTTKDLKLSKGAQSEKASILRQINVLRDDFPQLNVQPMDATDQKARSSGDTSDDQDNLYEDTDELTKQVESGQKKGKASAPEAEDVTKKEVPANGEARDIKRCGFLTRRPEKKGDKKPNLFNKLKSKNTWCVLRRDLLYVYEKKTSKKQQDCICVAGYEAKAIDDATKKDSYTFELSCPGQKTHVFDAADEYQQQDWIEMLGKAAGTYKEDPDLPSSDGDPDGGPDGYYDDADLDTKTDDIEDVLYEDTDELTAVTRLKGDDSPEVPRREVKPPAFIVDRPAPKLPPPRTDADEQEIYEEDRDAGGNASSQKAKTPPGSDDEIYDDNEIMDDIYDDTEAQPDIPKKPVPPLTPKNNDSPPNLPGRERQDQKALPPAPRDAAPKPALVNGVGSSPHPGAVSVSPPGIPNDPQPGEVYENTYYGLWDCKGDQDTELSFRRGDMIHVVSKKFGDRGWWVGRLNGRVGLVPNKYLAQAYDKL